MKKERYIVEMFLKTGNAVEYVLHTAVYGVTEADALDEVFEETKKDERTLRGARIRKIER